MKSDFMVKNVNFHSWLNLFKWQAVYLYRKPHKQINLFTDIKRRGYFILQSLSVFETENELRWAKFILQFPPQWQIDCSL